MGRGLVEPTIKRIEEFQRRLKGARENAERIIRSQKERLERNRRLLEKVRD